jgi:signal transduction histidine kinase
VTRWRSPAVAGAGFVLGVVALVELQGSENVGLTVADGFTGLSLLTGGAIIERTRRERALGWLLVSAGLAWFVPDVVGLASGVPSDVVGPLLVLHRGLLAHAFLTFPSGRARNSFARVLVGAAYPLAMVPGLWSGVWPTLTCSVLLACLLGFSAGWQRRSSWGSADLGTAMGCLFWSVVAALSLIRGSDPTPGSEHALLLTYEATLLAVATAFVVGVAAQARLSRVTDLVVELGASQSGGLAGRLSWALDDPLLQVGYWSAATHRFVDANGSEIHPQTRPGRALSIVRDQANEPVAVLVHDEGLLDDPVLRSALEAAASLSLVHATLQTELRATLEETEESRRRLLRTADDEREQLEARLQAGAAGTLARLGNVIAEAASTATGLATGARIAASSDTLGRTLEDLARLAHGLNPRRLVDLGLNEALRQLTTSCPVPVHVDLDEVEASPAARTCIYFVCSEALANVAKHAPRATCHVSLRQRGSLLALTVEDDGPGGASLQTGSGLAGLADRVETLGGSLSLTSSAGEGTRLSAIIPDGMSLEA